MKVVIAGGGTAGHVNPAIALAHALRDAAEVSFIGTARGLEARIVPEHGFEIDPIEVRGFDRARPLSFPGVAARAVGAVRAARALLAERHPDAVVGMGGYVSLPACLAARSRSLPVVIHEQNIVLGLANRVTKPFAARVAVSFEETMPSAGRRAVVVGNPVLPALVGLDRGRERARALEHFGLDPSRKTVLIFGGSQGAQTLNRVATELGARWRDRHDLQILHIHGPNFSRERGRSGAMAGPPVYHAVEYVEEMGLAYVVADLALCRGGATTVAELGVVGLPAIVVPYPYHRDQQQERHGRVLERAGAAVVVADSDATADRLAAMVDDLLRDEMLARMATAALSFGRPDAAERLANVVKGCAR